MAKRWNPGHYFYAFNGETRSGRLYTTSWDKIKNNSNFKGVQIAVWWSTHETSKDTYDFSGLVSDLATINSFGKKCVIRLMDRSFHGYDRGNPLPAYIDSEYDGEWADDTHGEDLVAPKMWLPEVTERWCLFIEACIAATKDAGSGCVEAYFTEECSYSGAYHLGASIGYTIAGQNTALLKIAQRGAAAVGSDGPQFWMNMGWSNEDHNDFTEHYRMTDEIVRTRRCGIGPTDLQSDSNVSTYTEGNSYGQYIYQRYAGEAVFPICHEYSSYMNAPTPTTLINYAYDLGIHYVMWEDMDYATGYGGRTVTDAINAVDSSSGKINSTRPANLVYTDGARIVADLAAITGTGGGSSAEMVDTLLYDAQHGPEYTTTMYGADLPNVYGGHEHTSFKSQQDFCAQWSSTPAWPRVGGNGAEDSSDPKSFNQNPSIAGHPIFINSMDSIVPWFWCFTGPGHNANNTGLEVRNAFAMAWNKNTDRWDTIFEGARIGGEWASYTDAPHGQSDGAGTLNQWRSDGITTILKPIGNIGVEVWPEDTVPSRGILKFLGARNRDAIANAKCYIVGAQVRLALVDPGGANDLARAVFLAKMGFDFFASNGYSGRYDYYGWPLTASDGGSDRWKRIASSEWVWIGSVSIGSGTDGHYADPGLKPPAGRNWSPATPYNDIPTYSVTAAQIRANPPPLPKYVSGTSSGQTSGWATQDYYVNPSTGSPDGHWSQQGADKAALTIYNAMVNAGWLAGFRDDTPVAPELLPGIPQIGKWVSRFTTEATDPDTVSWGDTATAQNYKPVWPNPYGLPLASAGVAYTATLVAQGLPAATYSHVSGKPSWMSVASNGDITGTPNEAESTIYSITFRATNSEGSTDITLQFEVAVGPTITTTTLPSGPAGSSYLQQLIAVGLGPLAWTASTGSASLAACGLSLSQNGYVSGTLIAGALSFTARVIDANGLWDEQAYSVTFGASNAAPAITTTTMSSGTINIAYSPVTINVTGAGTIYRKKISGTLPPGMSLAENTGVVSGTPLASGTFVFTVRPESEYGVGDAVTLSITIFSAAAVPVANPFARLLGGV